MRAMKALLSAGMTLCWVIVGHVPALAQDPPRSLTGPQTEQSNMPPTSLHAPTGKPWEKMGVRTFPGTPEGAFEGCMLAANHSPHDPLTQASCEEFGEMIRSDLGEIAAGRAPTQCVRTDVPNGTVFDFMSYKRKGKPYAEAGVEKSLPGYEHPALLCYLGDGAWGYFFYEGLYEDGNACNNTGVVMLPPKKVEVPKVPPVVYQPTPRQPMATWQAPASSGQFIPGFTAVACLCPTGCNTSTTYPSLYIRGGGTPMTSGGYAAPNYSSPTTLSW